MLKQMQKRQQTYFTYQQNKFMRTTNIEGGMKDAESGESIRQTELRASHLCPCFIDCFKQQDDMQRDESHNRSTLGSVRDQSISEQQQYNKVLPNNNQDMWLKYIQNNLLEIDDLMWVRYLLQIIHKIELQFNTGKYRGALFHLNFQANEKKMYLKKLKKFRNASKKHNIQL